MKEAMFYQKLENGAVRCDLCPRHCMIKEGENGFCNARANMKGTLYSIVYERPSAINIDPIEKKPLFHFIPGSSTFSIGTIGCNLECKNCQNWELSRASADMAGDRKKIADMLRIAIRKGCKSVSYTYNEPTVFFEMMLDMARLAKEEELKNVMVTNGYIEKEPLLRLIPVIDAFSVDLKAIDDDFYKKMCNGRLQAVKDTLLMLKEKGKFFEITNLVIPGLNDSFDQITRLAKWISSELGRDVPLHLSRFFPHYKLKDIPPTPEETIKQARKIAMQHLDFVYTGNIIDAKGANTYCPKCEKLLIGRSGFGVLVDKVKDGRCVCGQTINGIF